MLANGVSEYVEGMAVEVLTLQEFYGARVPTDMQEVVAAKGGHLGVYAMNEGGYNSTFVDLVELIAWCKQHHPELLQ